ncbi:MAG TPA: molybdopterin dinucleotide binding domain-containing protein, partial [Planctomycetota bacterium]|nr:molybdopterin dinucleotide binding domain-containing protein [Planctomycetota bacterium]
WLERKALGQLRWLVVRDMVETETAAFWRTSPEVRNGLLSPDVIPTEVFLIPAAGVIEKDGSFTNTQRLIQYHERAVDPPGDARSDAWFMYHLGRRLKEKAKGSSLERDRPLGALTWDYPTGRRGEPDIEAVLREINGYRTQDGTPVGGFDELEKDDSTACGCWIYSGIYAGGRNRANEREPRGPYGHGWGFTWPRDERILYNRASARPDGRPWSERKKLVWWDEENGEWTGHDVPDFSRTKRPDYAPPDDAQGDDALAGDKPFIMHEDGVGWIWVSSGVKDGPLPTHYEPLESPVANLLYPDHPSNPAARRLERPDNPWARTPDPRFPYVLTTYRLTEHHTAGGMSRSLSHLAELQPELFCEISPELAAEIGVAHGDEVIL